MAHSLRVHVGAKKVLQVQPEADRTSVAVKCPEKEWRLFGTIIMCHQLVVVGISHALMGCWNFRCDRRRRTHQPAAAAEISITAVAGSGTAAFAIAAAPLPAVWPKWERQTL